MGQTQVFNGRPHVSPGLFMRTHGGGGGTLFFASPKFSSPPLLLPVEDFFFFFFFELSILPTLFLILGWGGKPERLEAGSFLLLYTLAGALPLF